MVDDRISPIAGAEARLIGAAWLPRRVIGFALGLVLLLGFAVRASASIILEASSDRIRLQESSPSDLEDAIRRDLEKSGEDPYLMSELARVVFRKGHLDAAKRLWDDAAAKDPNIAPADIQVISDLIATGQLSLAEQSLNAVRANRPQDVHVYMVAGELAAARRDYQTALKSFEQAVQFGADLFVTHLALGDLCDRVGATARARELYLKATSLAPRRPEGWVLLAAHDFRKSSIDSALESLRLIEQINSDEFAAELHLAEMYVDVRDYVGALPWYEAALVRHPEDNLAQTRMAQMLMQLKQVAAARTQFEAVIKRDEFVPALVGLAELEHQYGDRSAADGLYRRALKKSPQNVVANNNLAMLLVQTKGDAAEAKTFVIKARRAVPGNPAIEGTLGCVLWYAGDYDRAADVLAKVVRQIPTDPWLRFAYGSTLNQLGHKKEGLQQLRGCLLLDPKFPRRPEIVALLESNGLAGAVPQIGGGAR